MTKTLLALSLALALTTWAGAPEDSVTYEHNPSLKTVLPGYRGNAVVDGQFQNETSRRQPGFLELAKWGLSRIGGNPEKANDTVRPGFHALTPDSIAKMRGIVWLGHSSLLIQDDSTSILIDPVSTFPFATRYSPAPIDFTKIPRVDYLLVSHGHYDHLDLKVAAAMDGKHTQALVPLRMGPYLTDVNESLKLQEAGWWQKFQTRDNVEIILMPAKHWHRRKATDQNKVLWGGFWIRIGGVTIYYPGDTSSSLHFKQIREVMGSPDIVIMPIGAYRPASIMKTSHMDRSRRCRPSTNWAARC